MNVEVLLRHGSISTREPCHPQTSQCNMAWTATDAMFLRLTSSTTRYRQPIGRHIDQLSQSRPVRALTVRYSSGDERERRRPVERPEACRTFSSIVAFHNSLVVYSFPLYLKSMPLMWPTSLQHRYNVI